MSAAGPRRILSLPGLRVLYIWGFLSKLSVLTPFFALFLAYRLDVGTAEITLLFATYSATRLLSELPLGALADWIGETQTLRLSSALALAGVTCLVIGPLPALFLGQVLFALSESASSGAQESLLYRLSNDDETRGLSYRQAQPAFTSTAWSAVVCAGVLGKLATALSLDFLGLAAIAIAACTCGLSLWLPTVSAHSADLARKNEALRLRHLGTALGVGGRFRFWFVAGVVAGFLLSVTYFTIQPLLNELEIASADNGLLYSAVTVFAAYGAHLANRLNAHFKNWDAAFGSALALVAVAIIGLYTSGSLVTIFAAMALLRFSWGWLGTTTTTALNEAVPVDELRATIMSVQSLLIGLLNTTALAIFAGLDLTAGAILLVLAALAVCGIALTLDFIVKRHRYGDQDVES